MAQVTSPRTPAKFVVAATDNPQAEVNPAKPYAVVCTSSYADGTVAQVSTLSTFENRRDANRAARSMFEFTQRTKGFPEVGLRLYTVQAA